MAANSKEGLYNLPFNYQATQIMLRAVDESALHQQNYSGTEHIGMAVAKEPIVDQLLKDQGTSGQKVGAALNHIVGVGDREPFDLNKVELTPRAERVIFLASEHASGHNEIYKGFPIITTASILTGLLQEGEGIGGGVLENALGGEIDSFLQQAENPPRVTPDAIMRENRLPLEGVFAAMLEERFHAALLPGEFDGEGNFVRSSSVAIRNGHRLSFGYTRLNPLRDSDVVNILATDVLDDADFKDMRDPALRAALRRTVIKRDGYFSQVRALTDPSYYDEYVRVERWPEQFSFAITKDLSGTTDDGVSNDSVPELREPDIVGVLNVPTRLAGTRDYSQDTFFSPVKEPLLTVHQPAFESLVEQASRGTYRRKPRSLGSATISPVPYYKDPQNTMNQLGRFISGLVASGESVPPSQTEAVSLPSRSEADN